MSVTINNVMYSINGSVATVSGVVTKTLTSYNIETSVLYNGGNVPVTEIGQSVFQSCVNAVSITIPNSITKFGESAFNDCRSLNSISIPYGVTQLTKYCFLNCIALTSITIPNSVTSIERSCFHRCKLLGSITIPSSVTTLGQSSFQECSMLSNLNILSNNITELPHICFANCTNLVTINIPSSVTAINDGCFGGCSKLENINIPNGVTAITNGCFSSCDKLVSIYIPSSVTLFGIGCFEKCFALETINIPIGVTSIGDTCFNECFKIKNITIPNSVTAIGSRSFQSCSSLASITMPNTLTSIGASCFQNCSLLNSVVINSSKTLNVSSSAFQNKSSILTSKITFNNAYSYDELSSSCKTISTYFYIKLYNPTIGVFSIPNKNYGDTTFQITPPTSNSSGVFSYFSSNLSVATINGNTVTIVGAGTSTITTTQSETTNHTSGTSLTTFQVNKATPTITNFSIPTKIYGDAPFQITSPTSNSSGAFSYSSSNSSVATIIGNMLTIVSVGTSTIIVTQSETTNYTEGTSQIIFQVNKATPTITRFLIPIKKNDDAPFQIDTPTSNSLGAFSYASSNSSVATINGNTVTIVGAGISLITVTQSETTNYTEGTAIASFNVSPVITGGGELELFLQTDAKYAIISESLTITSDMVVSSEKALTSDEIVTLTKN